MKQDKYEEFKKWFGRQKRYTFLNSDNELEWARNVYADFERCLEEQEKQEKEVKKILDSYIPKLRTANIQINKTTDECYNELKKGDYLKW